MESDFFHVSWIRDVQDAAFMFKAICILDASIVQNDFFHSGIFSTKLWSIQPIIDGLR